MTWLWTIGGKRERLHVRRNARRAPSRRLELERLEDRLAPATNISIITGAAGAGTLDHFLSATQGTITTADDPGDTAATLSVGALQGVGPGVNVSIAADATIHFNDLGALNLQTGTGLNAAFTTNTGAIDFANVANTVTTGGGSLTFSAGTDLTVANLNTMRRRRVADGRRHRAGGGRRQPPVREHPDQRLGRPHLPGHSRDGQRRHDHAEHRRRLGPDDRRHGGRRRERELPPRHDDRSDQQQRVGGLGRQRRPSRPAPS